MRGKVRELIKKNGEGFLGVGFADFSWSVKWKFRRGMPK